MSDVPAETAKAFCDMVSSVGRYPPEAFLFVREGLGHAATMVHGEETPGHLALQKYLVKNQLDWEDIVVRYHAGSLPSKLAEAIDAAGGIAKFDRHISGRELCWGLRDYALRRWGLLARSVFNSWGVESTADFGRIVFGFIQFKLMHKQERDCLEDFQDVFAFDEAFDGHLELGGPQAAPDDDE